MPEYSVYQRAERSAMAVETNMDAFPLTNNLTIPTADENNPIVILERVSISEIEQYLDSHESTAHRSQEG